ncbi:hypothetical protein CRENBAI_012210 [Crenichthys baileyi]|uniref:Secreted protein n=1 Tax=Crenichthys baileyi TaxID=28760 RepID=A0AAV9S618_9TELE
MRSSESTHDGVIVELVIILIHSILASVYERGRHPSINFILVLRSSWKSQVARSLRNDLIPSRSRIAIDNTLFMRGTQFKRLAPDENKE